MFNKFNSFKFAPDEEGAGGGATPDTGAANDEPKQMTFDEMLASRPEFQKEFDRRTNKAAETARSKEHDRLNKLHNEQLTEQEKLQAMNAEEKRAYQEQKREKELRDRERAISKRELVLEAKSTLKSMGVPEDIVKSLDLSSAEAAKAAIENIAQIWSSELEALAEKRDKLKGGRPPKDAATEGMKADDVKLEKVEQFMRRY